MIETILSEGQSPGFLPTYEAPRRTVKGLCSEGIPTVLIYGSRYLPFAPNGINRVEQLPNEDIISYNFTGCIMASYTDINGRRWVCHVSTGGDDECRPVWNNLKTQYSEVYEFKPSDNIIDINEPFRGCYGVITWDRRAFSIITTISNNIIKVARITPANLQRIV